MKLNLALPGSIPSLPGSISSLPGSTSALPGSTSALPGSTWLYLALPLLYLALPLLYLALPLLYLALPLLYLALPLLYLALPLLYLVLPLLYLALPLLYLALLQVQSVVLCARTHLEGTGRVWSTKPSFQVDLRLVSLAGLTFWPARLAGVACILQDKGNGGIMQHLNLTDSTTNIKITQRLGYNLRTVHKHHLVHQLNISAVPLHNRY